MKYFLSKIFSLFLCFSSLFAHPQQLYHEAKAPTSLPREKSSGKSWDAIFEKNSNAVVRVSTANVLFDWIHPYSRPTQSLNCGTAFFINEEGYLVTNAHVVKNGLWIQISLPQCGQEQFTVEVVGMAPDLDIALLKLVDDEKERLLSKIGTIPYVTLGNSDSLTQAEELTVIGYPLGFDTLRCSIGVYAGPEYSGVNSLLHVTASINQGNSGGPLLDKQGNVIGVIVSKIMEAELIGYAIPINHVKHVLAHLLTNSLFYSPRLYIIGEYGSDDLYTHYNNDTNNGMLITKISQLSLLKKAGVKKGDILYSLGYKDTEYVIDRFGMIKTSWNKNPVPFSELYYRLPYDKPINFTIIRDGEKITDTFIFNEQTLSPVRYKHPLFETIDYEVFGGLVLMELSMNHYQAFFSPKTGNSLPWMSDRSLGDTTESLIIVTEILGGSPAFQTRSLYAGSIINKINGLKVKTLTDVRTALMASKDKKLITFEEKYDGYVMALSLEKIRATEQKLADQHKYSISPVVKELLAAE